MTDRAAAAAWITRYRAAWESNAPADIRALVTDDGRYFAGPGDDEPAVGGDAIVADRLESADQPVDTEFEFDILAVDGDVAIARCDTPTKRGFGVPRASRYPIWGTSRVGLSHMG